jgi:hypothetical protein
MDSESADVAPTSAEVLREPGRSLFTLAMSRGARPLPLYALAQRRTAAELGVGGWRRFERLDVPVIVVVAWSHRALPCTVKWHWRQFAVADDGIWFEDVLVRRHTVRTRGVHAPWFVTASRELDGASGFDPWGEAAIIGSAISAPYDIAAGEPAIEQRSGVFRDGTVHYEVTS